MSTPLVLRRSTAGGRAVSRARLRALRGSSPATAPVLLVAGAAILVWDYAILPAAPLNQLLYWSGLLLAIGGVWIGGLSGRPSALRQNLALIGLGLVTWLPYLLRSPDRLLFMDERYHLDVLDRMAALGTTALEPRLYALPGSFPGLENATLTLMAWTGLPAEAATRLITLAIHVAIPIVVGRLALAIGLGRRAAFMATLLYISNTSYFFFHSIFSYETLGILLYLASWLVVALHVRGRADAARRPRLELLALPLLAAIAVTHHVSSYMLLAGLAVAWLVLRVRHARAARSLGNVVLIAALLDAGWFVVNLDRLRNYLVGTMVDRLQGIAETLFADHSQPRTFFANSDVFLPERLIALTYPVLVLLLGAAGIVLVVRADPGLRERWLFRRLELRSRLVARWLAGRGRPATRALAGSLLWPAFAIVGPIAWLLTTPAVLTHSSEIAYRAWPFLFLGIAPLGAIALDQLGAAIRRRRPAAAGPAVFGVVALLLVGGFSIGDNQAGRFPVTTPTTAAGPANATPDAIAAARWLRTTFGDDHVVATDSGSAITFSTDGAQRILRWNSWYPFLVGDPARIVPFMRETGTEFIVVDLQITELPPRYNHYFGPPDVPSEQDPGQPIPLSLVERFDTIPELSRIYDNGRIRIYALTSLPGRSGQVGTAGVEAP